MTTTTLRPELDDLRTRVAGTVTGRDDPGCDEARAVWNGMVDAVPGPWCARRTCATPHRSSRTSGSTNGRPSRVPEVSSG